MLPDSLFVSPTVHPREIELGNGEMHVLYFKELPGVKFAAFNEAKNSANAEEREGATALLISASVCGADGSAAMSYEQAKILKPKVMNAVMKAILEINGYGTAAKKE